MYNYSNQTVKIIIENKLQIKSYTGIIQLKKTSAKTKKSLTKIKLT